MKIIKKITALLCCLALLVCFAGCGDDKTEDVSSSDEVKLLSGKHHAVIKVQGMGDIKLELDADVAPITVTNFVNLVNDKFYDGLTFHRVINGFMIQGGDPEGNGTGGSGTDIKGEFLANGIQNNIAHTRGVISMARNGYSYDSASSQFFIMHNDADWLDGQYAAFGRVTEGMEIVDKIATETPVTDDNGTVATGHKPIIESIRITD